MAGRTAFLRSERRVGCRRLDDSFIVKDYENDLSDEIILGLTKLLALVHPEREWSEAIVRKYFVEDERVKKVWIIQNSDRPVAVMAAQVCPENGQGSVNVHWISIHPLYRRQHLGELLLGKLWNWAEEHGKTTLYAYSTTFTSEVEKFYERLGFVETRATTD